MTVYLVQYYSEKLRRWVDFNGLPRSQDRASGLMRLLRGELPNQKYRVDAVEVTEQ